MTSFLDDLFGHECVLGEISSEISARFYLSDNDFHLKSALAVSVVHQDGHPGSSNIKRLVVVKEIKRNL